LTEGRLLIIVHYSFATECSDILSPARLLNVSEALSLKGRAGREVIILQSLIQELNILLHIFFVAV
jgi:hypothetical protein